MVVVAVVMAWLCDGSGGGDGGDDGGDCVVG